MANVIPDLKNYNLVYFTPIQYIDFKMGKITDEINRDKEVDLLIERSKIIENLYNDSLSINQIKGLDQDPIYMSDMSYEEKLEWLKEKIDRIGFSNEIENKFIQKNDAVINKKIEDRR